MNTRYLTLVGLLLVSCHSSRSRSTVYGHLSGGDDATRTETHALEVAPGERLELVTPHGRIEVRAVAGAAPSLQAVLRASGRTLAEAEQVLAGYALSFERGRGGLRVQFEGSPVRIRDDNARISLGASVDYVATVPEGLSVDADTSSGDIHAVGPLGSCRLETRYGSIEVEGVRGDVRAVSGSGDVLVREIRGGRLSVESGYGSLRIENVDTAGVRAESRSGDVVLVNGVAGKIELDTAYGAVSVRGAKGDLHASSRSGDVDLADIQGGVDGRSQYGKVTIEGVLALVSARSSSGRVTVRAHEGSTNTTNWELSSGYGAVSLHVPAEFGCQLEAHTRYGDVECDFPITVDAGKRRNGALKGVVGPGGRIVKLSSGSGNLGLHKL